jgi:hypothetical protein
VGAGSNGKTTRHQRGARGSALSLDIEIQQPHALAGKFIDARSCRTTKNTATINAQLTIAEIVREHQDDVGFSRRCNPCRQLRTVFLRS